MSEPIVIIGNGIAGITAARHVRKISEVPIYVISAETKYFFSRTALMYIYMGHMKFEHTKPYEDQFWEKNRIDLIQDYVTEINVQQKQLKLQSGNSIYYGKLVLATGSKPNYFGWPGQDLEGVQGLYSYQDLERMEKNTEGIERAVIVGGGLIGVEMAEMLRSRDIDVTFLVRETEFWDNVLPRQEAQLVGRHIREHHVDLQLQTELKSIEDDGNGRVKSVITSAGEEVPCQFVGLTAGVSPNIDFLKHSELETARGILVNHFLQTNIPDVYAIGDCAELREPQPHRRSLEQVWYTGRMMGEIVAQNLTGTPTPYIPGHWFNSAKFFDIEYQTYGKVNPQLDSGEEEFYWEHKNGKVCIHFVFEEKSRRLVGVNVFGIRMRHETFDQWLNESLPVDQVISRLDQAVFDPEFYASYTNEILQQFNREYPEMRIEKVKRKRFLWF